MLVIATSKIRYSVPLFRIIKHSTAHFNFLKMKHPVHSTCILMQWVRNGSRLGYEDAHRRPAKVQASMRFHADSTRPLLLAHFKNMFHNKRLLTYISIG